jgi:hypothetical protein
MLNMNVPNPFKVFRNKKKIEVPQDSNYREGMIEILSLREFGALRTEIGHAEDFKGLAIRSGDSDAELHVLAWDDDTLEVREVQVAETDGSQVFSR